MKSARQRVLSLEEQLADASALQRSMQSEVAKLHTTLQERSAQVTALVETVETQQLVLGTTAAAASSAGPQQPTTTIEGTAAAAATAATSAQGGGAAAVASATPAGSASVHPHPNTATAEALRELGIDVASSIDSTVFAAAAAGGVLGGGGGGGGGGAPGMRQGAGLAALAKRCVALTAQLTTAHAVEASLERYDAMMRWWWLRCQVSCGAASVCCVFVCCCCCVVALLLAVCFTHPLPWR